MVASRHFIFMYLHIPSNKYALTAARCAWVPAELCTHFVLKCAWWPGKVVHDRHTTFLNPGRLSRNSSTLFRGVSLNLDGMRVATQLEVKKNGSATTG